MPRLETRYDHVKVYRPAGTLFAEGSCTLIETSPASHNISAEVAIGKSFTAFFAEFSRRPSIERTVIEVSFGSKNATAILYELPDE